ncbi:hypothetical protein [Collimonas humicola]|uniref:hypothetical protein n=1 Tax=Collimonas humicola TaxID=2825886 RepID=UPI001B8A962C|nr:hypothetical protein [Collimonas humicola]
MGKLRACDRIESMPNTHIGRYMHCGGEFQYPNPIHDCFELMNLLFDYLTRYQSPLVVLAAISTSGKQPFATGRFWPELAG